MLKEMAFRCVAIDEDPQSLQVMKEYVERSTSLLLLGMFEDAVSAVQYLQSNPVDLLFADMKMKDAHGLDLIRAIANKPMIIFTTTRGNFSSDGFESQAIDYLVKPVSYEKFEKAVAKAIAYYKFKHDTSRDEEYLYVYSEYRLLKIDLNEIEFIESLDDHIRIHLTNSQPVLSFMPMKRVLKKLPAEKFQRVHQSYIVALNKIKGVNNKRIVLADAQVPVSDSYLDVIRKFRK